MSKESIREEIAKTLCPYKWDDQALYVQARYLGYADKVLALTAKANNEEWAVKFAEARKQILKDVGEWIEKHHHMDSGYKYALYLIDKRKIESLLKGEMPNE